MKRKVNVGLSFLLILCLCVSMVAGVSLPVSAAAIWTDRSVQQQIFTNTALAYFYKGDAMQYGSYYIASGYRYAGGITRGTPNRSPEDATSEDKLYNVCSVYPHDIYFEAFGEHILTDEMAIPVTSQIHSVNFETDSVNSDFLTSVQNSTENYCYHGAMAKAAGFDVDTVDVDARENTADADNVYADVLDYFGPDLDVETGEPITYAPGRRIAPGAISTPSAAALPHWPKPPAGLPILLHPLPPMSPQPSTVRPCLPTSIWWKTVGNVTISPRTATPLTETTPSTV